MSTDAELRQRVARLEQQLDAVLDELRRARAGASGETTGGASPPLVADGDSPPPAERVGRRHLLQVAGAAAAGAVAATAGPTLAAPPPEAAQGLFDGDPAVGAKGIGGPGVRATTDADGIAAVDASTEAGAGIGVLGVAKAADGTGVEGRGAPGVRATGAGGSGLTATATGAAAVLATSDVPLLGATIEATNTTANGIAVKGTGGIGVWATGTSGVSAHSTGPVYQGAAVEAQGGEGYGVTATSNASPAIRALGMGNIALFAQSFAQTGFGGDAAGMWGRNDLVGGVGVKGTSDQGVGVLALGRSAIRADGSDLGIDVVGKMPSRAQVHLWCASNYVAPPNRTDTHYKGEIYLDNGDDLWLCVASGTPGTWRKLAGPATAGALHVLTTPVRVYDSRPGNPPDDVVKGPLANATSRTIDATHTASGVPAGATAVLANVTVVNTSAAGFLALYRNGIAYPGTSTVNWSAPGQVVANLAVTALDSAARLAAYVPANSSTDFLLDVIGYWR